MEQKLQEIILQNTVTVKIDCQLNQQIIGKNFGIIMDCLKQLSQQQKQQQNKINGYDGKLSAMQKQLLLEINKATNGSNANNNNGSNANNNNGSNDNSNEDTSNNNNNNNDDNNSLKQQLKKLQARTTNNQNNILDNIKDINLLNKQIKQIKQLLDKLKGDTNNNSNNNNNNANNNNGNNNSIDMINSISKDMNKNNQSINKINGELEQLKSYVNKIDCRVKQLQEDKNNNINNNSKDNNNNNNNQTDKVTIDKSYFNDLNNKLSALQKKVNQIDKDTEENTNQIKQLISNDQKINQEQEIIKNQLEELRNKLLTSNNENNGNNGNNGNNSNLSEDLKRMQKQIDQIRSQLDKMRNNQSRTSLDDDNGHSNKRFDKANYTQVKFGKDDLLSRIQNLEKMLGSRKSIEDQSKKDDKLPLIKRPNRREKQSSMHERSAKKDMNQIKLQLQNYLTNYLANSKSKDNFEELELKILEIKNLLGKKADQEGLRKGLTFLENKINQLYIFLMQPDGEDAMIVRKGINCLSCSKKVEKLRGKLGPYANWNHMTATNYSPPKVGYSKNMGQHSADRDDDL